MHCISCGTPISEGDAFCMNCGEPVEAAEVAVATEVTKPTETAKAQTSVPPAAEPDVIKNTEKSVKNLGKNKLILLIAAAVVIVIGGSIFAVSFMGGGVDTIPREYEKAVSFFQNEHEKIDKLIEAEDYAGLAKALNRLDMSIGKAMDFTGEDTYPEDVLKLCEKENEDIADIKMRYAMDVTRALSDAKNDKELVAFYHPAMLNIEAKNELLDMMIPAFIEEKMLKETETLLRERINPFTEDAFQKVMEYKALMDEKYPDREMHYAQIDAKQYDMTFPFSDGMARVAINDAPEGAEKKYKWGLINKQGEMVADVQYDTIGMLMEGFIAVEKNGKWGFLDESGNVAIPLEYEDVKQPQDELFYAYAKRDPEKIAKGFYEGFTGVKQNGKWGFIDQQGRTIGEGFVYDDVEYFNEGVASVKKNGMYGLINANGVYIAAPGQQQHQGVTFGVIRTIYEGLAGANWDDRRARGIIDKTGTVLSVADGNAIDLIQDFREGLASVRKRHGNGTQKWGFIDRNGYIAIPVQYDTVTVFINGVSKVSNGGKYGLINRNGNVILPIEYEDISDFDDGYATIKKNGKFGFVDERGYIIAQPEYENVTRFANGVAAVKKNGKWGVINTENQAILPPVFSEMKSYHNGVAPVKYEDKWGYVDLSGYFLIDPIFEQASVFSEGVASVKLDDKFYYISLKDVPVNLDGQVIDDHDGAVSMADIKVYETSDNRMREPIYVTRSDNNGMFKVVLPAGDYKIVAEKEGYVSVWSYESISQDENNYATTINLAKGNDGDQAESAVLVGDALNGEGLSNAKVYFRKGYNNGDGEILRDSRGEVLYVMTDGSGIFTAQLPIGTYTAEVVKDGYATTYINFMSSKVNKSRTRNQAMTQILADGETRITLEWGPNPPDLDTHLVGPKTNGYEQFHLYYSNMYPMDSNCTLDKDDTQGNGFETTTIRNQMKGTYRFSVFDYTNQSNYNSYAMSMSGARVNVYQGSQCVASFDIPANKLGNLWEVFEINGNRIVTLNNVTNHHDYSFYTY